MRLPAPRLLGLAGLLCFGLLAAGCMETDEVWEFDANGGGVYALTVRWNADLWRRASDHLKPETVARLEGSRMPLRAAAWRDGLEGLEGIEILSLEEKETETEMREIAARIRFRRLEDLLRWELLARRTVRVTTKPTPAPAGEEVPPTCHMHMGPLVRIPVLDPLADLLAAVEQPTPGAEATRAQRELSPLERFGLDRVTAELVWRMVKPQLSKVRLRFRIKVPGSVVQQSGKQVAEQRRDASFEFDFPALRNTETDRRLRLAWRMRAFDKAPRIEHEGERAPRPEPR